jgi:succinate dehydrogenase/fumarate reductase-like Fe-S protein
MSGAPAHEFDAQMRKENRKRAKQGRSVIFKIKRCDGPGKPERWESFKVPVESGSNVISCLKWIAANPVTTDGKRTTPVVWDSGCLEEVCGACTMVINGRARQSCSCLIDEYAPGEGDTLTPRAHEQVPGHPRPLGRP